MIFLYIILALLFAAAGGAITYWYLRPRLIEVATFNKTIEQLNFELQEENCNLNETNKILENLKSDLNIEINNLKSQIDNKKEQINILDNQSQEAADIFYKQNMALAEERFDRALEDKSKEYQEAIQKFEKEFLTLQAESVSEYENTLIEKKQELANLLATLTHTHSEVAAAVEAAKRAEEIKNEANFYRLQLSEQDIKEIQILRSIGPQLRDIEPLNKVIWKVYYEKPTTDLIGRVIGSGVHTGIYKITNIENQMCYVGQAADLASRWKQHIKRGIGADTPTKNKLYPAMMAFGPENFTFEVIEKCDRAQLDQQEDYWQDYFLAKEFGYSIK